MTLLSCYSRKDEDLVRQKETIAIIQTLLEEKGVGMVRDFQTETELPICLNLKKVMVQTDCFEEPIANDTLKIIKLPEKSFINQGEVCIEKIYNSRSNNNLFFLKTDSLSIVEQNQSFTTLKIPKSITQKFKTVAFAKNLKIVDKYIQFSIPIFSKDNTKAYVQCDHYTTNESSYGVSIYLMKIDGKWKIKNIERNWAI